MPPLETCAKATAADVVAAPRAWMVRAGRQGAALSLFMDKNRVAVGWGSIGDLTSMQTRDAVKAAVAGPYEKASTNKIGAITGCLLKVRRTIEVGDAAISYDPSARLYHVGVVREPYSYEPNTEFGHWRGVDWIGEVLRDELSEAAKYRLGSLLTVFEIHERPWSEICALLQGQPLPPSASAGEVDDETEPDEAAAIDPVDEALEQAHEYRKDAIGNLAPDEMEEFVACVLRGMGYRARVTARGPDRGRDIEASPDGLGLEEPRIRVEVKHRRGKMGAQEVRAFLGALRPGDKGLYVSTGGFTKEAMYEAERSQVPASLVDLDRLAELYVEFYEELASEDRELVPLRRVYWPGT